MFASGVVTELDSGEAQLAGLRGERRRLLRRVLEEHGHVHTDPWALEPAEELVDGLVEVLAEQVPAVGGEGQQPQQRQVGGKGADSARSTPEMVCTAAPRRP